MNIEYVGRHVTVDASLRELTEEKIAKLSRFLGEPVDVHVTLGIEKSRQIAEVRVVQRRGELLAREEGGDLLEALRQALDKIDGQARRANERRADRRRRAGKAGTVHLGGEEVPDGGTGG